MRLFHRKRPRRYASRALTFTGRSLEADTAATQRQGNLAHDIVGYRLLHAQQVVPTLFVDLRPKVAIVSGVNQIRRDAHLGTVVQEGSLEHRVHIQSFGDLPHGHLHPFVVHDGAAGDDAKRRAAGQVGDELVGHSVYDVVLIGVLRQVDKRQDRDGMESADRVFGPCAERERCRYKKAAAASKATRIASITTRETAGGLGWDLRPRSAPRFSAGTALTGKVPAELELHRFRRLYSGRWQR